MQLEDRAVLNPCRICGKHPHKIYQSGLDFGYQDDVVVIKCMEHKDNIYIALKFHEFLCIDRWNEQNIQYKEENQINEELIKEIEDSDIKITIDSFLGDESSIDLTLHLKGFTDQDLMKMFQKINKELLRRSENKLYG